MDVRLGGRNPQERGGRGALAPIFESQGRAPGGGPRRSESFASSSGSPSAAAGGSSGRLPQSESFLARDAAFAQFLGQQEDAELARRLAMAEAARAGWSGLPPTGSSTGGRAPPLPPPAWAPPTASEQPGRCPRGHDLKVCTPGARSLACDGCGQCPIPAHERTERCEACAFVLCAACAARAASARGDKGLLWRAPSFLGGPSAAPSQLEDEGMLYVPCEIGDVAVEMMVDTGAQTSVISLPFARQLGLMKHLDSSTQGIASGVGHARIVGRLRAVQVKLGHVEFFLDFSVLEIQDNLFMLGLDQMRRFKCIVDLERKCLVFGGSGGIEVPFLQQATPKGSLVGWGCPTM